MIRRCSSTVLALLVVSGCGGDGASSSPGGVEGAARPNSGATGASTPTSRLIDVAANQGWQDTGIAVRAGQPFRLAYRSGQISHGDVNMKEAAGRDDVCGDPGCCEPLPDEHRGMLIGRIAGEVFVVGNGGEYKAAADGTLQLRVNDCDSALAVNKGTLSIEVVP
jgi:hypothetical protein